VGFLETTGVQGQAERHRKVQALSAILTEFALTGAPQAISSGTSSTRTSVVNEKRILDFIGCGEFQHGHFAE
jgi:hypothetical protein